MQNNQKQLDKLLAFKQQDKLSAKSWGNNALDISSDTIKVQSVNLFNSCTDNLIAAINANASDSDLKSVLKAGLASFKRSYYKQEEREFICARFYELATIADVNLKDDLNSWLHGPLSVFIANIGKFFKSKQAVEILHEPCSNCNTQLESQILKKEKSNEDSGWFIVKCSNCDSFNLLSLIPGIKKMNFVNYTWIETLNKKDYSYEEAVTRLEQIQYFRK